MAEISDAGMPGLSTGTFARITGEVQGVSYRASAKAEADELGLTGWVRNTADGAVELLLGGEGPDVGALLRWAQQGPAAAEVAEVRSRPATEEELRTLPPAGFEVRR